MFALDSAVAGWILAAIMSAHTVIVVVQVKLGMESAFEQATLENAIASRQEPGISRFDLLAQTNEQGAYLLVESYRTAEAPAAHKETAHYQKWRDTVAPMMAQPRSSKKYREVGPQP